MYRQIKEEVARALAEATGVAEEEIRVGLEIPKPEFGDLASSVAFALAKREKKNPALVAKEIAAKVKLPPLVQEVKVLGPYLNFVFTPEFYCQVANGKRKGRAEKTKPGLGKGAGKKRREKVLVEYPSVNPNKPWHSGHLRNAVLGDCVANLLEFGGYQVERIDYIDDLGLQVAQSLWGYLNLGEKPAGKFDQWLGREYVRVSEEMEKPAVKRQVEELMHALEKGEGEAAAKGRWLAEECVKAQYATAFRLGIYHDALIFESDIMRTIFSEGMEKLRHNKAVFLQTEGENKGCYVVKLAGEEFRGLKSEEKVLIRSNGLANYTGKDVIFHLWKFGLLENEFNYAEFIKQPNGKTAYKTVAKGEKMPFGKTGKLVNIIGSEQIYPQQVVKSVLTSMGFQKQAGNYIHLSYEHVVLPEEKLSGRTGTWIGTSADEIIDEGKKRAAEKIKDEMGAQEKDEIAEKVAVGAIRFAFVRPAPEKRIVFRWEEALNLEGDSAPYVIYAHARCCGIMKNFRENFSALELRCGHRNSNTMEKAGAAAKKAKISEEYEFSEEEKQLLKQIALFSSCAEKAATECRPHYVADYLLELATLFNKFYNTSPILKAEKEGEKSARLEILQAAKRTLKQGLELLGIEALEKM